MVTRIQLRRDRAANWTDTNPILDQGEPGYETDTGNIKYGDGASRWSVLPYGGGPSGPGNTFTLNTATGSTLGGVKIGTGLNINASGVVTVSTASISVVGGVKVDGSTITITNDGTISSSGGAGSPATTATYGTVKLGPIISVYQANTQTVTSNTSSNTSVHIVNYNQTKWSSLPNGSIFDGAGNFTPYVTGYYQVNASVNVSVGGTTSTSVGIGICRNGAGLSNDSLLNTLIDYNLMTGTYGDTAAVCSSIVKITSPSDTIQAAFAIGYADDVARSVKTNSPNSFNSVMSIAYLRPL
jgi:hypothetical protein